MSQESIFDLMALPTQVDLGRGKIKVRGLALEELLGLISRHDTDFGKFFKGDEIDFKAIMVTAPKLVADALAMSTGFPVEDIRRVPVGQQLMMVEAMWKETVPDPKKIGDLLLALVEGLRRARSQGQLKGKSSTSGAATASSSLSAPATH